MANAGVPAHRLGGHQLHQARQFADLASHADGRIRLHDRQPSRVVAPVLQPLQPFQDNGGCVARPYVAYNAAHTQPLLPNQ
jgi:hypothetical protein